MLQDGLTWNSNLKGRNWSSIDTRYLLYLLETDLISIFENNANTTDSEVSIC